MKQFYLFSSVLIIISTTLCSGVEFANGDFENGNLSGWRTYFNGVAEGSYQISQDSYQGSYAVHMDITNAGVNNSQGNSALDTWSSPIELYGAKEVLLTFAAKNLSSDSSRLHVKMLEFSAANTNLGATREWFFTPSGNYQQYSCFYSLKNSQASKIVISFRVAGPDSINLAVGSYMLDAVSLDNCERIYNGGFEDGLRFWRWYAVSGAEGSATVSPDAFSGSSAARLQVTAGGGNHGLDREEFKVPVYSGETIILEFAAKKISSGSEQLRVTFSEHNGSNTQDFLGVQGHRYFDVGEEYSKYICSYTAADSDAAALNIIFKSWDDTASTGEFLIDDVRIVTDILPNSGFESDLELWRCYSTAGSTADCSIETADVVEGQKAARFEVTQASNDSDHGLDRFDYMPKVQYGDKILFSFYAKEPVAQQRSLMLSVTEFDSQGNAVENGHEFFSPESSYRQFTYYYDVKGFDTRSVNLCFKIYTEDGIEKADGVFLIDGVNMSFGNGKELSDLNYDGITDQADLRLFVEKWTDREETSLTLALSDVDDSIANQASCSLDGSFDLSGFDGLNIGLAASSSAEGLLVMALKEQDAVLVEYEFNMADFDAAAGLVYADLHNLLLGSREVLVNVDNILFELFPETSSQVYLDVNSIEAVVCECQQIRGDFNLDYRVDLLDLKIIAEHWVK
ncbi:Carbohydrate binding domain protein [Limihaloglobus sulfuriphilus]|uniref:Carbohydrate binding domain protein n=1 Tax=Limihaloglobus sulfuriphilus TaxID=1851148 RepID=A0A1Q2MC25_9BACT|nr:carbohydrate binding domain-containing protein [Limihaloglobus sulfuriphilus]AQQ70224.1 Carbohydrate binding domain protein [Limihaloglobus sulfuriphilus]